MKNESKKLSRNGKKRHHRKFKMDENKKKMID